MGLDKKRGDIKVQRKALYKFLDLADTLSLPVVLHCRGAEKELLEVLRKHTPSKKGVWHCFSQNEEVARDVATMGFFISFSPSILQRGNLSSILAAIPFDRILIETDAPYIARSPADVVYVAKRVADTAFLTLEDVARITSVNAHLLFGIGKEPEKGVIAYKIRNSLYLNITNRCTNDCVFCIRKFTDFVKGHNLRLKEEPSAEKILDAVKRPSEYEEIVFCGYGEPTLRWDVLEKVAKTLKERGARKLRLNTNGHVLLINGEGILQRIGVLFDKVCVSVDASDKITYQKVCRPSFGGESFSGVLHFIKAIKPLTDVELTVVDYPEIDLGRCKKMADTLSVPLRIRRYKEVG